MAAVSFNMILSSDGSTYLVDSRAYVSNDADKGEPNDPRTWANPKDERSFPRVNVGEARPEMGRELGREIGEWFDDKEVNFTINGAADKFDYTAHFQEEVPRVLNELLVQGNTENVLSFNLNNILTERGDKARVLLWQPFVRE